MLLILTSTIYGKYSEYYLCFICNYYTKYFILIHWFLINIKGEKHEQRKQFSATVANAPYEQIRKPTNGYY